MRFSTGIGNRLCEYIKIYARWKKRTEEDTAKEFFGISNQGFRDISSGVAYPSLQVCEVAIKRGCDPRYLFLGDNSMPGDPIRCFAHRSENHCMSLEEPQCVGYDRCPFYQPERIYLARTKFTRTKKAW